MCVEQVLCVCECEYGCEGRWLEWEPHGDRAGGCVLSVLSGGACVRCVAGMTTLALVRCLKLLTLLPVLCVCCRCSLQLLLQGEEAEIENMIQQERKQVGFWV